MGTPFWLRYLNEILAVHRKTEIGYSAHIKNSTQNVNVQLIVALGSLNRHVKIKSPARMPLAGTVNTALHEFQKVDISHRA